MQEFVCPVGAPRNLMLSINETVLKAEWEEPGGGETDEQIQNYMVECSFMKVDRMYTLKHIVSSDTLVAPLPIIEVHSDAGYNCCVEAVFETYSSKTCSILSSTVPHNQVSPSSVSTKSESPTDVHESTTTKMSLNTNAQQEMSFSCIPNSQVHVVAGVLGSVILIISLMLLTAIIALVHTWHKMMNSKEENTPKYVA